MERKIEVNVSETNWFFEQSQITLHNSEVNWKFLVENTIMFVPGH